MILKFKVNMEYCYGINKLQHEFTFENNNNPVAIYAPNGSMKTSLARSFQDFSRGRGPKDLVFPERVSNFNLLDENDNQI